jgi:radical SAM superfamily enzyme YgiQ (UPF0313 family)
MNILLINICLRKEPPIKLFPIGLGYIATAIKNAGFVFDLLDIDAHRYTDEQIESLIRKKKYDVVCMGCVVTGYKIVKTLASVVKKHHPHSKIIVGNSVATSIVGTLLTKTNADIAVLGEGDETIVDLLKALSGSKPVDEVKGICFIKDGKLTYTGARPVIKDISSLPFIDHSLFATEIYIESSRNRVNEPLPIPRNEIRPLHVSTARGCIAKCTFCYHNFQGTPFRFRSAESIIAEIKYLIKTYSLNYIFFWDDLTFASKKSVLEFSQKVIDEEMRFFWIANCMANLFQEDGDIFILKKAKEAGCVGLVYALESADPAILRDMNKNITVEQFSRQSSLIKRLGIPIWTSVVFGYPRETPETIKRTFDVCIENEVFPSTGYLQPYPGSKIYDYAVKNGFIPNEEEYLLNLGDRQDLRLNMTSMSDEDYKFHILEGLKRCNEKLNVGLNVDNLIKTQYFRAKGK